ncbi:urease accessory protein UreH domain-containing protein [Halorussus litoreus]|uniref:urease accessory protein UreH domain-containing protein n=1 Tax=Halorussus litoreus TaxID=1710536 RepID=UPI000E25EAAB|nr:sulfite exporter TauE/SafE family protein [Halorussus litoreus]
MFVPLHGLGASGPTGNLDAAVFLVVGLLGGAHCLGMCGRLVTVYADRLREREDADDGTVTVRQVRQHLLFDLGRTAGYAVVGALVAAHGRDLFGVGVPRVMLPLPSPEYQPLGVLP